MPRRSARRKTSEDKSETALKIPTESDSATNSELESASKNQSQKTISKSINVAPAFERKEESAEPVIPVSIEKPAEKPTNVSPAKAEDDDDDDEFIEPDRAENTLATTRSRRSRTQVSYKDESSSEDDDDASDDASDSGSDDNPLFSGLNKAQRAAMKAKMAGLQNNYDESARKEREQSIEEIISSFEFNIGETVTKDEAGFAFDFCRKHQLDINDKIEEEGDFFLINIREMMQERLLQIKAGVKTSNTSTSNKKRKHDADSDSEFDMNDFGSDSDSEYDEDSDWEDSGLDLDHENLLSDDDDVAASRKKKKRRRKNVFHADGKQYYAKGRLLLSDALKDTTNFEGWSAARVQAWKNKEVNPNAYYYRFNEPGEENKNGRIGAELAEHKLFMQRVVQVGVNHQWGSFSKTIPGRVGYQCSNYWRQMMKDAWVKDPNYWIRADGSFQFKRAKKGSIPDPLRKYSFVVLKDPSGVFDPLPGAHPKRPSDKALARYLQNECKSLSEKEKAGGKRSAPKKRATKNSNKGGGGGDEEGEARAKGPKKPQSAYFLFSATVRAELKAADATMKVTQMAKEAGKRWKALGDEGKKPFHEQAAKAKIEWRAKMDAFLASEEGAWLRKDMEEEAARKANAGSGEGEGEAAAGGKKKAKRKKKKDDGAPKKPQSAYLLYRASVRASIKEEFAITKASDVAREAGKKWKALSEEDKKPFVDQAAVLKEEWKVKVEAFNKQKAEAEAAAAKADQDKAETETTTETNAQVESQDEAEVNTGKQEAEAETESDAAVTESKQSKKKSKSKAKGKSKKGKGKAKGRGKKRKHDGVGDDLEPAQKKRRLSDARMVEEVQEVDDPMAALRNLTDLVTGERVVKPAMSPYGHVMEYDSWCSILRNPATKNTCPFTQQPMTRRQLVKLDEHNIEQYKVQIVNLTADDMQKLST